MGHSIQTLEAEDARLLLESSPEVPFYFQYFYMNMVHYYQHFFAASWKYRSNVQKHPRPSIGLV